MCVYLYILFVKPFQKKNAKYPISSQKDNVWDKLKRGTIFR